jgi:hypothetical protein
MYASEHLKLQTLVNVHNLGDLDTADTVIKGHIIASECQHNIRASETADIVQIVHTRESETADRGKSIQHRSI